MKKLIIFFLSSCFANADVVFTDHIPGHTALVTIAEKEYSWNGFSWDLDNTYIFTEGGCPLYYDSVFGSFKIEYSIVSVQWTLEPSYFHEIKIGSVSSGEDDEYIWTTGSSGGITVADVAGEEISSTDIEWEIWTPGGSSPDFTKTGSLSIGDIITALGRGLFIIKVGDGSSTTLELSLGILTGEFALPGYSAGQIIGYAGTSGDLVVGKMPGSTVTSSNITPVNDPDHFVYKLTGVPTGQSVQAFVYTTIDSGNWIELEESSSNSGIYWSDPQLLVADQLDDNTYSGSGTDEGLSDQTHKVRLDDEIYATSIRINNKTQNVSTTADISIEKTLSVRVRVLHNGSEAVADINKISGIFDSLRSRYAQVSIDVEANHISTFTTTVNFSDGVSATEWATIRDAEKTPSATDFELFIINFFEGGELGRASFTSRACVIGAGITNAVNGELAAHELGHLLWNDDYASDPDRDQGSDPGAQNHHSFESNIMERNHPLYLKLNGSRRWTELQESKLQEDIP